jgi:hypothetical protein
VTLSIPELEQSKTAVLNTLASMQSRRSYEYAIDKFIAWYCSEPRLTFNRSVVVRYRSFLERLSLSGTTINLRLSAIRRLADESAESGWLSPELAIGIRRVKGVKRLGRKNGQLAHPKSGSGVSECRLEEQPTRLERWSNAWIAVGMWFATLGNRPSRDRGRLKPPPMPCGPPNTMATLLLTGLAAACRWSCGSPCRHEPWPRPSADTRPRRGS